MKKTLVALAVAALQFVVLTPARAETPAQSTACGLCAGVVGDPAAPSHNIVAPTLLLVREDALESATPALTALSPDHRKQLTVIVTATVPSGADALTAVEAQTSKIVTWAKQLAPLSGFGVSLAGSDTATTAYMIKRLSVTAQGEDVAARFVLGETPRETLAGLFEAGAASYFDAIVVEAPEVAPSVAWLMERDPSKKVLAVVTPDAPNALFNAARALADGASLAFVRDVPDAAPIAAFNTAMAGDYAFDATSTITVLDATGNAASMPVLAFVRGEDLRTLLVPRGDASAAFILSLPSDRYAKPRRVDASGAKEISDVGQRAGRFLVGSPATRSPFAITLDQAEVRTANVTKEAIDIATQRGIAVEEIIRNHQAYKSFQTSIQPPFIAKNTTRLRFAIGDGAEVVEASIVGDFFSRAPEGSSTRADWVWSDFYINGVKWKYGRIPELPLVQPEKVTQQPLDIHLTNEYRYELVREMEIDGYPVYEVRFEPPPNAPESLPLYRGTVWIDRRTWARIRISMVQLNLTGEVLSNEEQVDFQPFRRDTFAPIGPAEVASTDPRSVLWLVREVNGQQVVSAGGRANVVLRSTSFTDFRISPADFDAQLSTASASDARMVRETEKGLRYLEKTAEGERVVKEGFDTSRKFLVGGIHHDEGLEYPVVPLGGVNYFNFNLRGTGIQTNVFFAGVVLVANATHPNVADTRTNVGADLFAIAVPTTNTLFRNGIEQTGEAVKVLPTWLTLRAGRPFLQFGKIDVQLGMGHETYQRSEDTAAGFEVPSDTFVFTPGIDAQYSRRGWTISGFFNHSTRTSWNPWGNLAEYSDDQKSFSRFGGAIGKSFFLPKFQRIGVEVNYLDGQRLDRFSKYELGFFGARRVHGIRSGTVRAEKMILGHLSYGFVVSEAFRLEAFYDHALIDDTAAGYRREPFQGIGIGGQTVGPWGTLIRLDIGKSIGRNADGGLVANVVFLKLF